MISGHHYNACCRRLDGSLSLSSTTTHIRVGVPKVRWLPLDHYASVFSFVPSFPLRFPFFSLYILPSFCSDVFSLFIASRFNQYLAWKRKWTELSLRKSSFSLWCPWGWSIKCNLIPSVIRFSCVSVYAILALGACTQSLLVKFNYC